MGLKFKVLPHLKSKYQLYIPHSMNEDFKNRMGYIRFGLNAVEVEIHFSDELPYNQLMISKNIIDRLNIPIYCEYELKWKGTELIIGPYIGILACKKKESLHKIVQNFSNYLYDYQDIGGMIIAFSQEGIDMVNEVIDGYVYNPQKKQWYPGSFSYPVSIIRRAGLSKKLRNHLHSRLGNTIFNNYLFDKYEMYQWLMAKMKDHLPETIKYKKPKDITRLLLNHNEIYIKPTSGSQGKGIIRVTKLKQGYEIQYQVNKEDLVETFKSEKEMELSINQLVNDGEYLIQQGLNLIQNNRNRVDFRVILMKNYHGIWTEMGVIGKYSDQNRITSNVSTGGKAKMANEIFRTFYHLSEDEIFQLRNKIKDVCLQAANEIECRGVLCGNFGLDIAIDENYHIWIIEINNRDPNHTIAIDAKNRHLFYQTKKMNIMYAKKLAGF